MIAVIMGRAITVVDEATIIMGPAITVVDGATIIMGRAITVADEATVVTWARHLTVQVVRLSIATAHLVQQ